MNNLNQLQSYSLEKIQSRSYLTLPCPIVFKEELSFPSHNTHTFNIKLLRKQFT